MSKWKDDRRKGEIVGATLNTNKLKISVHHHIHYEPELWLLSVDGLIDCRKLKGSTLDEAKCQAKAIVQVMLEEEIASLVAA